MKTPWPRTIVLRHAALVVATTLVLTACVPGSTDGPAGFCGWIGTDVEGLGPIVATDGSQWVGTWYHVFAEGVTDADGTSRDAIARAITADSDGFERLRREATEQGVGHALDRLYALLQDPTRAEARDPDPEVQQDVDLIDSQGCDFLRQDP